MATTRLGLYGGPRAALDEPVGDALLAEDLVSNSEVTTPAIGQTHVLLATSILATSNVTNPVLVHITGTDELLAEDLESASIVGAPNIGQSHALVADDLVSLSSVSTPRLDYVPPTGASTKKTSYGFNLGMMGSMGSS